MEYVVFGAGGTGGCLAGFLARAGFPVTVIARGAQLEAIREKGLAVRSARVGDFTVPVAACAEADYRGCPDVIFVCVKSYSLSDAAGFVNRAAGPDTLVVPILNGFGTGAVLQASCGDKTVLDGCIYIMSMIESPGVIRQSAPIFRVFFGFREAQDRRLEPKALRLAEELSLAGIHAVCTGDILREELKKFSFVSPMGAACLYLGARGRDFKEAGPAQELFFSLVREAEALGRAMGITCGEDLLAVNRKIMLGLADDATTSMQRDVLRGHVSEIDGLVYRVPRLAARYGLRLPNYERIAAWAAEKGIR